MKEELEKLLLKTDFYKWFEQYSEDNHLPTTDVYIDEIHLPIEVFTNIVNLYLNQVHKIYIIPTPITGSKNGYDSFPIIGWNYDILYPQNSNNSYYMGYPVLEWFHIDRLEEGETLEEYNVEKFKTIFEALFGATIYALKHITK